MALLDAVRFARMAGSSIAAPDAAGWVTDFLNAAYYARPPAHRDVDDLRLAHALILTAWWRRGGRRLHAHDLLAFHRAFVAARLRRRPGAPRGTLDRAALLAGGERLLGVGFPEAYADPERRAWGIVFRSAAERASYVPELRLRHAALGALSPPAAPAALQRWHTYAPVRAASADGLLALLRAPERWPDAASALGRFTPVRSRGLAGQTFEIEVVANPVPRVPVIQRGYVSVTRVVEGPAALGAHVDGLARGLASVDEPGPLPAGAAPLLAADLTTHAGHFMGPAVSHLLVFAHEGKTFIRDIGQWDPMAWYLGSAYRAAGRVAQASFWGERRPEDSMLHQMGLASG